LPSRPGWLQDAQVPVHETSQHTPSAQAPVAQSALAVQAWPFFFLQPPLPSHAWPSGQLPGTSAPGMARAQIPSEPGTLHELHTPAHATTSQHTPSTQNPLAHEAAAVQPSPLPRLVTLYSHVSRLMKSTATPRLLSKTNR
jgi:hypothetical protein